MRPIPLFYTSSSRSQGGILTVEKAGEREKLKRISGPVSVCDVAKREGLKEVTLLGDNMQDFMTAAKNLGEAGIQFRFGLRLVVCENMADKSDQSFKTESRVVVFLKDSQGYVALCKLLTKAATDGFYYCPRIDWTTLCAMWSEHFLLALPFYSSFLAKNTLTFASIVPHLPVQPLILDEIGQQLPFDFLIRGAIKRYGGNVEAVKSIYYDKRDDARAFQVWRAALDRKTWDKPNDGMMSREFCTEAWRELT